MLEKYYFALNILGRSEHRLLDRVTQRYTEINAGKGKRLDFTDDVFPIAVAASFDLFPSLSRIRRAALCLRVVTHFHNTLKFAADAPIGTA